ncbi:hypothetical protein [Clostridium neonatale]|uniref:Uncharacterized protein n=1 Tax=Siphoviridae sp. ct3gT1 TaxID=2825323 RepID=A0A8S5UJD1_9CAUD|nr:hypothetical protein CNEO4_340057 [Clostridium neonatale]DAF94583.1 MAG TPA: hypothetical protein [Siphoviridae sp. ct3gT1]
MNKIQAIEQLKDLRENQKNFIDDMEDPNNDEFVKDVEALDLAIKALEGTALEVPVQEQSKINFSPSTGKKLHEVCPNCWVKNKPYKCGFDKCPGYKLLLIESTEEK